MAEEANRTGGLFLPYPLLGLVLTLVLALGGGIAGLFIQVNSLQTTILLRDSDYQRERQQSWEKIEQMQVYIQDDRERLGKLEERLEQRQRPRN
jgi:uncharacterized protein HemX